ncbi:MAG: hypothetical protein M3322_08070, partial [Actinomycetota bacterium]|nr:hypothetical protein [Actinomycetota bacterium]
VCALEDWRLPFSDDQVPPLRVAGVDSPLDVARSVATTLAERPSVLAGAFILAAAAAAVPLARRRGAWGIALLGAWLLTPALLPAPPTVLVSLVASIWATCLALALADRMRGPCLALPVGG